MRRVILAAAFAATFCLSQTSLAQTGDGGGAGAGAPAGGVPVTNNTPGPGASGGEAQGGPPTTGSFSVQNEPQGTSGNQVGGTGGAGQAGVPVQPGGGAVGTGQPLMGPGDQVPGAATGQGQSLPGTGDQGAGAGGAATGTGSTVGAGGAATGTGGTVGAGGTAGAGEVASPGPGSGGAEEARATSSPRAGAKTVEGPASEDPQVELAKLRAEVDRLRAELGSAKGVRSSRKGEKAGTGGSGAQVEHEAQPVASASFAGRVKKVSRRSIEVIDYETGEPYVLRVNKDTRAQSGNRPIPVTGIREGSEVRASFDLISGDTFATQIDVIGQQRR